MKVSKFIPPTGYSLLYHQAGRRSACCKVFSPILNPQPPTPDALFWVESHSQPKQAYALKPGVDVSALPTPLQSLDVALLDNIVFQQILGQSANKLKHDGHLHFIREESEIKELLETDENAVVFWVHSPSVEQVRTICESGHRMPQKSTYFYPKLLSGLVLYYYGLAPIPVSVA